MAFKIGDLFVKLGLKKDEFDKGLTDAKQQTSSFASAIGKIGGAIAGAFAVGQLVQFGKEVFNIATQAQGVQTAFSKIGTSGDLDNLRSSVKGTVSDLELMKRAVMASNFGIPVKELGRLFEFAAKRAQDTGQSIDYLVDSIVTGIGRKSPLILDNLGISAVQLKQKLGDVGMETASVADITRAVGQIAEESLNKTGRLADNLGTKVQTLAASWENLKMTISSLFSESEMLQKDLDDWSKLIRIWQSDQISGWEKFWSSVSKASADANYKMIQDLKWLNQKQEESFDPRAKVPTKSQDPVIKSATEQLAALKKVTDELEAQRILRQEFKGEKMQPMTPLYQGVGDLMLPQKSADTTGVFGNLDSHYKTVSENRKKWTEEELRSWNEFVLNLNDTISTGFADAITSMAEGLGELAAGTISGGEFGKQVLATIGKFMQTLGSLMIAYAINMGLFAESAKNPLSWPVALAAGVAMVAAGAALSSVASKGLNGSSSSVAASGYSPSSSSSAVAALNGNVVFELEGTKLRGVLNNQDRKNNLIR